MRPSGSADPEGAALWAAIERNHQKHWAKTVPGYVCDYHFGVGPTGVVFAGQPLAMVAFNCGNARINAVSIAVCFLGNFQVARMPAAQYAAGVQLLRSLCVQHSHSALPRHPAPRGPGREDRYPRLHGVPRTLVSVRGNADRPAGARGRRLHPGL